MQKIGGRKFSSLLTFLQRSSALGQDPRVSESLDNFSKIYTYLHWFLVSALFYETHTSNSHWSRLSMGGLWQRVSWWKYLCLCGSHGSMANFPYIFFILFYFSFYFTILYWFCHTSTCIHHRCTCVPHPEPPSHLPPHTVPLGHPRAPAPNFLYPALNLNRQSLPFSTDLTAYVCSGLCPCGENS